MWHNSCVNCLNVWILGKPIEVIKMTSKIFRRRKKLIKPKHQLKLACFVVIFLLIYSLIFGLAIFYPLAAELRGPGGVEDQARVAFVVLGLHETIWPALVFVLALSFVGTILFSHRVAGPIYRLEKAVEQFLRGDFSGRIRLRKTDEFKEIETVVNGLAEFLDSAKSSDERFHADVRKKLSTISAMLDNEGVPKDEKLLNLVNELILKLDAQPHAFTTD